MVPALSTIKLLAIATALGAALVGVTSFLLLQHQSPKIWVPFTLATIAATLHVGAALLVWKGLTGFKAGLRHAYKFICIALVFVGFTDPTQIDPLLSDMRTITAEVKPGDQLGHPPSPSYAKAICGSRAT